MRLQSGMSVANTSGPKLAHQAPCERRLDQQKLNPMVYPRSTAKTSVKGEIGVARWGISAWRRRQHNERSGSVCGSRGRAARRLLLLAFKAVADGAPSHVFKVRRYSDCGLVTLQPFSTKHRHAAWYAKPPHGQRRTHRVGGSSGRIIGLYTWKRINPSARVWTRWDKESVFQKARRTLQN